MYSVVVGVRQDDGTVRIREMVANRVAWRAMRDADNAARRLRRRGFKTVTFNQDTVKTVLVASNGREGFILS